MQASDRQARQAAPQGGRRGRIIRRLLFVVKGAVLASAWIGVGAGGYLLYRKVTTSQRFHVAALDFRGLKRIEERQLRNLLADIVGEDLLRVDLMAVERRVESHPWVARAEIRRQLPQRLLVSVTEQVPRAVLLLEELYLVNAAGRAFKRSTAEEAQGLVVLTGVTRAAYRKTPRKVRQRIREGLKLVARYQAARRPKLSEIALRADGGMTAYLARGGTALRFGRQETRESLRRFDAVWSAVSEQRERVRALYLDNGQNPQRVVVRMAQLTPAGNEQKVSN